MNRTGTAALWLPLIFFSCTNETPINKFTDPVHQQIADYQDQRQTDSLFQFFTRENPYHRMDAVLAFASIQDSTAIEQIGRLFIEDKEVEVRLAAAFALGQIGTQKAFHILYRQAEDSLTRDEMLESCGKTAGNLSSIPPDLNSWGLYRLAIRGLADSMQVKQAMVYLKAHYSDRERLGAAHFFARGPAVISQAGEVLLNSARTDSSVFVRMAATQALRKIKTPDVVGGLGEIIKSESDYRVRINAVRALQAFSLTETRAFFFQALDDQNINVAIASAESLKSVATIAEYAALVEKARASTNWRVKANLYEAALAVSNHKELSEEIIGAYRQSDNPYEKSALLVALSHSPMSFEFVREQLFATKIPVIQSSAASALVGMNRHTLFEPSMQKPFAVLYQKALQGDDVAVIGTIASALADSALGYKRYYADYQFLYDVKKKLTLPRDNETLQSVEQAIAHFEGRKETPAVLNEFNHPIDWNLVKRIPKNQQVLIKTAKGDIVIQLLVEEAPGSVANFVHLVEAHYFDSKNFHRVVPNFVIQGGCSRGDGWGSEDYSIRSEFSMRRYKEGSVGMASAGKDTEGTQWFITHSPTPHLDGRYTIFAEVVTGMEVVHQMEVGDKMLEVTLIQ